MALYSMPAHTDALTASAILLYHHLNSIRYGNDGMLNALWIVLLGMAIIFAALGILLLAMVLLGKLRSTKEEDRQKG
jgi:hypothetical protein